jgi:ribonuclease VapC
MTSEPDADLYWRALADGDPVVGPSAIIESTIVLTGKLVADADRRLQTFLEEGGFAFVPFDAEMTSMAQRAFLRYGKGRHPAKLNFGDCMSYALAKAQGVPLLYKGDDFALTDIASALETR